MRWPWIRTDSASVPAPAPLVVAAPARRNDGVSNALLGLGDGFDKVSAGRFIWRPRLDDFQLQAAYDSDDLCARVVDHVPREAFREGYKLESAELAEDDANDLVDDANARLSVDAVLEDALTWSRLYGGGLILIGARDGALPTDPLNEANIQSIDFLNFVDRRFAIPVRWYADPMSPQFGHPEIYRISSDTGYVADVHETRCIRFDGQTVDPRKRRELFGWSYSVLQRPYEVILQFQTAMGSVGNLLADTSQGVFKLKNLIDMLAGNGRVDLETRMQQVNANRSTSRPLMLDADGEEFTREATPYTGIDAILDRLMMRVSSAFDVPMPVTILMGRSAAGMNATGDADFRAYYAGIKAYQKKKISPAVRRVYRLLALAKRGPTRGVCPDDLGICWLPLWTPDEKTSAEAYQIRATADCAYVTNNVLLPAQVAMGRFADGVQGIKVDAEKLQADIDNDVTFEPPKPVVMAVPPRAGTSLPAGEAGDVGDVTGDVTESA